MTRSISYAFALTALATLLGAASLNNNGKEGRTGSPGELTCRDGCHNTFALNSGEGSVVLSSANMVNWQYVPGTTYQMSLTVSLATSNKFGMGLEALTDELSNGGTLVITDAASTQIKNHTISGVVRRNVVHTNGGGLGTGSKTFNFNWVAPSTDEGPITFYFAGNATNSGNNSSGDRIYVSSQVVNPASTVSVADIEEAMASFRVQPNPFMDQVTIDYSTSGSGPALVSVYDVRGSLLQQLDLGTRAAGRYTERIEALDALPDGVLFIHLTVDGTTRIQRAVKQAR